MPQPEVANKVTITRPQPHRMWPRRPATKVDDRPNLCREVLEGDICSKIVTGCSPARQRRVRLLLRWPLTDAAGAGQATDTTLPPACCVHVYSYTKDDDCCHDNAELMAAVSAGILWRSVCSPPCIGSANASALSSAMHTAMKESFVQ